MEELPALRAVVDTLRILLQPGRPPTLRHDTCTPAHCTKDPDKHLTSVDPTQYENNAMYSILIIQHTPTHA